MAEGLHLSPRHREEIEALLRDHVPGVEVWAYGSRVNGRSHDASDLDLVLRSPTLEPLGDGYFDLLEAIEKSNIPILIQAHDWARLPKSFHQEIEREHVVLVEAGDEPLERGVPGVAGEWIYWRLEDCMAAIIDYRGKTPRKTSSGIPLITAKVVKGGRIKTPTEFIAVEDYDSWMRRGIPRSGDVLITTEAPLGEVAQLSQQRVALAQRLVLLRGKSEVLDNRFLKFLMQSSPVQDQLRARATGTTVLGIKQKELRQIGLALPPIQEQRAIAHILGTLDDKIELNRRMNETLEEMARALFKSWFVDFDAVRAKMEGRWRRGESQPGLPAEYYDLFPDRLADSGLGKIPEGWEVEALGSVTNNLRRGVRAQEIDPGTPYIALEHMPKQCIALSEWGTADDISSGKFEFTQGDILFGKLRPYFHKVGIAPLQGVCSTDIVVISPVSHDWFGFVLGHVSSSEFVDYTSAGSTGTKMPRTKWSDMAYYEVVLPGQALAKAFTMLIQPCVKRIVSAIHESRALATLRDTLLPKLVSGELKNSKFMQKGVE